MHKRAERADRRAIVRCNLQHRLEAPLGLNPVTEYRPEFRKRGQGISLVRIERQRAAGCGLTRGDGAGGFAGGTMFGGVAPGEREQPPGISVVRINLGGFHQKADALLIAIGHFVAKNLRAARNELGGARIRAAGE